MSSSVLQIPTAEVFEPLLQPSRYKGAHGGRGSGKSHFFAGLMVERALAEPGFRGVCVREVQKDLKESAKRLLEDKIRAFGLGPMFDMQRAEIKTPGGGVIIFQGMQDHNAESIKSLEGFDVAWVEEAHTLSATSLAMLRPTIRKAGSELWFSWNPRKKDDPVNKLLRGGAPPSRSIVVEANWSDNPWFPDELEQERQDDQRDRPDEYAHVWDGKEREITEATVFRNWRVEPFETPADAVFRFGADWGFANDPTVLVRCWMDGRKLYIDKAVSGTGVDLVDTPGMFAKVPGSKAWPITADSARPETISHMRRAGFKMREAIKGAGSIEEGVRWLQSFEIIVHPDCDPVVAEELANYSFQIDKHTHEVLPLLEDKWNNAIDAVRYACEAVRRAGKPEKAQPTRNPHDPPDLWGRKSEPDSNWKVA